MDLSNGRNLLIERPAANMWVVRFTRPDPRLQLDGAGVEDCDLYKDLYAAVLSAVAPGDVIIFNFGLVFWFPTAFFQLLLQVREFIVDRRARLILCGFVPEVQESMQLFKGDKIFEMVHTEEHAMRRAAGLETKF